MIKINNKQESVLNNAIVKFGSDAQVWMAIEEMAELNNALAKNVRGRANSDNVAEEVADVFIMMQALAIMTGPTLVQNTIDRKIERLSKRVESNNINLNEQ